MATVKPRVGASKPKPKIKVKSKRKPKVKSNVLTSSLQLPTKKSVALTELSDFNTLVYAPPKVGKTSLLASFEDTIFFFFEPGGRAQEVFKFPPDKDCIESWEEFQRGIDLLEKTEQFKNAAIDTGAAAYQFCVDYTCRQLGIDSPGNDKTGKRDRSGTGWRFLEAEFRKQINRIIATGRGVHFTAHSKEATIETRSGKEFNKTVPQFTGQCERVIVPLVDNVFFIDYYRIKGNGIVRAVLTKGDDLVVAGHRGGKMPRYVLLPEDEPERDYEVLAAAFKGGRDDELRLEDMMVSAVTSEAGAEALSKAKVADTKAKLKGGAS